MLPDSALTSFKVLVATPCYISAVSMNYVISLFDLTTHAHRHGLACVLHMHSETLIPRARNAMVRRFLADETLTHLFWIDSDVGFRPEAVCRLLLSDKDVCAAVYPMKRLDWPDGGLPRTMTQEAFQTRYAEFPFNPIDHGTPIGETVDADGFIEVAGAPNGFMCIKRSVFTAMMERYPTLKSAPEGHPDPSQGRPLWLFFDCMVEPDTGRYLSEDYAFCRRWRDTGGKIWVDADTTLQHLGQVNFSGNLFETLRAQGRW